MTAEQFTYWLQGFMEMANPIKLGEKETQMIKDHLALVFDKQTPDRKDYSHTVPPTFASTEPNIFRPICESAIPTKDGYHLITKKYC